MSSVWRLVFVSTSKTQYCVHFSSLCLLFLAQLGGCLLYPSAYDGGDCCECTCEGLSYYDWSSDSTYSGCANSFACIDPAAPCVDDDSITIDLPESCDRCLSNTPGLASTGLPCAWTKPRYMSTTTPNKCMQKAELATPSLTEALCLSEPPACHRVRHRFCHRHHLPVMPACPWAMHTATSTTTTRNAVRTRLPFGGLL